MDTKLLSIAALAAALAFSAPAGARHGSDAGMGRSHRPTFVSSPGMVHDFVQCRSGFRQTARRNARFNCGLYADGWAYADGEWAYSNNRSWDSDSYNDWWHDRPDRAFPRWVQEQRGGPCDPDRMWWSGSGWHC